MKKLIPVALGAVALFAVPSAVSAETVAEYPATQYKVVVAAYEAHCSSLGGELVDRYDVPDSYACVIPDAGPQPVVQYEPSNDKATIGGYMFDCMSRGGQFDDTNWVCWV